MAKNNSEETEKQLHLEFLKNTNNVLSGATVLCHEFPLFSASYTLTRGLIYSDKVGNESVMKGLVGKIDFIFTYKSKKYICEVKYSPFSNSDFWDALKVVGYTELYRWQTEDSDVSPAILIPSNKIRLEHQLVAGRLRLRVFLAARTKDGFRIKMLDDKPHWKQ